jgi:nicotinate dehydrogenase subunit B
MEDERLKTVEASASGEFSRRNFVKLLGGGIIIFFSVESRAQQGRGFGAPGGMPGFGGGGFGGGMPGMGGGQSDLNAYLKIGEDGKITVFSGKIEQGQGNTTALAQMAAEELGVSFDSINMIMGDTDLCPWDMGTFGSMSISVYGAQLRTAAAEAKGILLEMAAEKLAKPKDQLKIENGIIFAAADKKTQVTFAELTKGQKITRRLNPKPAITSPSDFKVIGKSPIRVDARDKVTGKAKFAGDFRFPDMLHAKILRPPSHASTLKNADTSAAEKMPGVTLVRETDMIAVLHKDPDIAEKARESIKAEFDIPNETVDEKTIFDELIQKAPRATQSERKGDLEAGRKAAASVFEQTYLNGYGAHASIETHTACAKMEGEKMTVWISTQTPFPAQSQIASAIRMQSQNVRVITPYVGGGFGGKSSFAQATEAARLAKITGKPIQVSYNRAEEFFYDPFRPAAIVKIRSGVNSDGKICLWDYHVYHAGTRSAEQFYDVPNNLMSSYGSWMSMGMGNQPKIHPFNTGAWRAPGANINIFAREQQIDIMAAKLKMDPLEFRLKNTSNVRMRHVLEVVAQRFGYKPAPGPSGRGIGIACGIDADSYVAEIAEVKVDKGNVKVKRIFAAQDMGISVNIEGSKMQMEGCIMMGLGYTLSEDISFKGSRLFTTNFHNYKIPRFSWLPEIDAFVVKNDAEPPHGGGEPAIAPVGGAVANAIFDATGVRVFQMPMTPERILNAPK